MKRTIALILLLCMALGLGLTSCGKKKSKNDTPSSSEPAVSETTPASSETTPASSATTPASSETTPASSETTPASSETTPASSETTPASSETTPASSETEPGTTATEPASSSLPTDFETIGAQVRGYSESDRTFKIQYDKFVNAEKASRNDWYVEGPDHVEAGVTPAIQAMVYERNKAAEELLDVTIVYDPWDSYGWGAQKAQIQTLVQGNATDAPELFIDMVFDLCNATMLGVFKDIWSIPGSFFDFNADGWMNAWMESMSLSGDRAYVLAGDYFLDLVRAFGILPFNMTMMDNNADKLAMAILGEELPEGETLSSLFFDLVDDGDWTWEVLGQICEAIYVDDDADGENSLGDTLGILGDRYGGMCGAVIIYSCALEGIYNEYTVEDPASEYYNKHWIDYAETGEALADVFDAVSAVFLGSGAASTGEPVNHDTIDDAGFAYHQIKFAEGTLLFLTPCVLGTLEGDTVQQMSDVFSVVPLPKLDTESDYHTIIHNNGDAGAINVNAAPGKTRSLTAFLQYCTVNSEDIRDEFLQIVTKYKTTEYNQGTDRMLDLIYDSVVTGREKMIDDYLGTINGEMKSNRWHAMMMSNRFQLDSSDFATRYDEIKEAKQGFLDEMLTTWYTLPMVEE